MTYSSRKAELRKQREERTKLLFNALLPKAGGDLSFEALSSAYKVKDPSSYDSPELYLADAQRVAFFSKSVILTGSPAERIRKAKDKWRESENQCRLTNHRFRLYWRGEKDIFRKAGPFLHGIQRRVCDMLGKAPVDIFQLAGRHGPGTTVSLGSDFTAAADKFAEAQPTCTPQLAEHIYFNSDRFAEAFPHYAECISTTTESEGLTVREFRLTENPSGRFTTVPKNFRVDRAIDVQASLNIFFQLGLGESIRRSLSRTRKVSLAHQADVNRHRVRTDCTCATIDLASASDTVSHNLVVDLVPPEWLELLDILRTPQTVLDGEVVVLEKWSAMGNGYTFELETLLFKAIAEEVVCSVLDESFRDLVLVFGDDIIVPRECAGLLIEVLTDLGFTPNVEKTFVDGPFRESCGVDVFYDVERGPVDVRPTFLRAETLTRTEDLYATFNSLTRAISALDTCRYGANRDDLDHCGLLRADMVRARRLVLSWIAPRDRRFGPDYLGDLVLQVDSSEWLSHGFNPKENKRGLIFIRVWSPEPPTKRLEDYDPRVQMSTVLYGQVFRETDDGSHLFPVRGKVKYREKSVPVVLTPPV